MKVLSPTQGKMAIVPFLLLLLLNGVVKSQPTTGSVYECAKTLKPNLPQLRKYNVEPGSTTVSGISNGGAYALQISFILSSMIRGAGIFAASPYPMAYLLTKFLPNTILEVDPYYPYIDKWSAKGLIDSTKNLKGFKAYVFHGLKDFIVHPRLVLNVAAQFDHYGADLKNMTEQIACGHCIPTRNKRNDNPNIGVRQGLCNVGFEGVFDMFSHLYGKDFKEPESVFAQPTGRLFRVDLTEFYPYCNSIVNSINSDAWMYVPEACDPDLNGRRRNETTVKCQLHLAFHGYQLPWRARMLANNHNALVEEAGYLQAADANNVIVLFPEALWRGYDIIGYTGPETFMLKKGLQNTAIKKMIQRITLGI